MNGSPPMALLDHPAALKRSRVSRSQFHTMSGVDYQAVPTSPDLEAAGARNLALLAADASDLNANEAKPRHDAAGRQPKVHDALWLS